MAKIEVRCPYGGKEEAWGYGKTKAGKQRFRCRNQAYKRTIFQQESDMVIDFIDFSVFFAFFRRFFLGLIILVSGI